MIMNTKNILGMAAGLMLWVGLASVQASETNFTFAVNQAIPDANVNGLILSANLTGLAANDSTISDVTLSLDITGGYNGDLYAYLAGPNGGFAVLLNRVGVSNGASAFGYSGAGLNVTFSDSAANGDVHFYQNVITPVGQLTGTWQPDGRNIDPMSSPSAFLSAGQTDMLSSFQGSDANGTWTLFLADLSSGGQSAVANWGLDITTVPEPSFWTFAGLSLVLFAGCRKLRRQKAIH